MTIKHKIILGYIKDLSVETPDPESLIAARENISKYSLNIDLSSKILKNKMIEVYTKLVYIDKINKKKTFFEMIYATVVRIEEEKPKTEEIKKLILCDLQIQIYPRIEKIFMLFNFFCRRYNYLFRIAINSFITFIFVYFT